MSPICRNTREQRGFGTMARREFFRVTAGTAAVCTVDSIAPTAQTNTSAAQPVTDESRIPLGNAESPALQFQAYPGGTGALMDKLWRQSGQYPFDVRPIQIPPWEGPVPSNEEQVAFLPVHRLAALIRDRHISPTELLGIYLDRLKRYDPMLLCAVTILDKRAQAEAAQAEAEIRAGNWRGPLHGIPYGVKDVFSVTGTRTTWGAEEFENQVIDEDAEVVRRLHTAGAVLMAKLATGQFAQGDTWYRGRTRNPWNPKEGSSGSSAGPASATAAGCVAFGIGTETQGSIVSPARRCGLSALRPTFGRVSRYGGMVLAWSMDKTGPLCRCIEDCALVFNSIHGADEKDPASLTTPFRFTRRPDLAAIRIGYTEDAPQAFLDKLRELGAAPSPMAKLPHGQSNALSVEGAAAFDFHIAQNGDESPLPQGLTEEEQRRYQRFRTGRDVRALDYIQSQRRRLILMKQMTELMKEVDMFVTGSGQVRLTNQTGHPAVVLPYAFGVRNQGADGQEPQPLTTTLVGDLFTDDKVLSVAHAFQSVTTWHLGHPSLG